MAYEKMKAWAFERKRRRLEKLDRAWTMEDDKLVSSGRMLAPREQHKLTTGVLRVVQHGVYGHVGRVEDNGVMRNIPIPSGPLTHSGLASPTSLPHLTYVKRGHAANERQ